MSEKRRINTCILVVHKNILSVLLGESSTKSFLLLSNVYHLPAAGVLPVQVQTVKVVLLNELDDILNEPRPGGRAVDQPAVLVSLAVIPAAKGQGHLDAMLLKLSDLSVHVLAGVT